MKYTRILAGLMLAGNASSLHSYEEFYETVSITTNAVPLIFTESDHGGSGALWRMPLDGGKLRFDVSTSGFFNTYINPLTLSHDGRVGVGTSSPGSIFHVRGEFLPSFMQLAVAAQGTDTRSGISFWNPSGQRSGYIFAGDAAGDFVLTNDGTGAIRLHSGGGERFRISANGNVGIGTTSPSNKLEVNGAIRAKEVIVETTGWPDYVFSPGYALPALDEVRQHIEEKGRLPGVEPASAIDSNGQSLGEMQCLMMQKIEELTLYVLEQDRRLYAKEKELSKMRTQIEELQKNQ